MSVDTISEIGHEIEGTDEATDTEYVPAPLPGSGSTVADMRDQLIDMDTLRERLGASEPVGVEGIPVGHSVRFKVEDGWAEGLDAKAGTDAVDAFVSVGVNSDGAPSREFRLTKDALLEATSICGLTKTYVPRSPANLTEDALNYWFRDGFEGKDFRLLKTGDVGAAFVRPTVEPFSNLAILDTALAALRKQYGAEAEVLADYKFTHSLRRTHLRLIVPETARQVTSARHTAENPDNWSFGLSLQNSLNGSEQTALEGYLFAWWCTNGATSRTSSSGVWSRRGGTGQSAQEMMSWAETTIEEILGGLEGEFEKVAALTEVPVVGELSTVLGDFFEQFRIPQSDRGLVVNEMLDAADDLTMYEVMAAATAAANTPGLDPGHVATLLAAGGALPQVEHERCGDCRRLLPH